MNACFGRLVVVGLLALKLSEGARGQTQPAETTPQSGIIRANVRQVVVPVVVTDGKGRHIHGLKASDFEIFEDGGEQRIVAFNTMAAPAVVPPEAASAVAGNTKQRTTNAITAKGETPRQTYLICVDVLHSAFSNFAKVRTALSQFFEQEHSADSQYALIALGRETKVIQDSTRDPLALSAAVRSDTFFKTIRDSEAAGLARDMQRFYETMQEYCRYCACDINGGTMDLPQCSAAKGRAQLFLLSQGERTSVLNRNFLQGLTELVKASASMPTTRTMIFISDGFNRYPGREFYAIMEGFGPKDRSFQFNQRDSEDPLQGLLKLAVHYNVKFYTLDSRGLYAAASIAGGQFDASTGGVLPDRVDSNSISVARESTDALAQLAHETGGLFFENNNDLLKGIHRAFDDGRESYVLAYVSSNAVLVACRRVTVTIKNTSDSSARQSN